MNDLKKDVRALLELLPATDSPGRESKLVGPDRAHTEKIAEGLVASLSESVGSLVDLLSADGGEAPEAYKARYALRLLTLHSTTPGREELRARYSSALAAKLTEGAAPTSSRLHLIDELAFVGGGAEAVASLVSAIDDDRLADAAIRALEGFGAPAAPPLLAALESAAGAVRESIVQALGNLRDEKSVGVLSKLADLEGDSDSTIRLAALTALAKIGVESSIATLLRVSDAATGWERIQATKACFVLAEKLRGAGRVSAARSIYAHLRTTRREESESHVRESAARALATL